MRSLFTVLLGLGILIGVASLTSCATLGYYSQALQGQMALVRNARPVAEVVADAKVPTAVRDKLQVAQKARLFAARELQLPLNRSYETYVDVGSPAVTWNVIAAPAFSVTPLEWCYPVAGCFNYRGYFSRAEADRYAADLRRRGYDVYVSGASAYSTLGWFDDPLVSTMLRRSEEDLVATIFHELAHQKVYLPGDSAFNEAFAVAVSDEGVRRWYQAQPEVFAAYLADQERQRAVSALLLDTRERLAAVYAQSVDDAVKAERKRAVFDALHAQYAALKASWGGDDGYDGWVPREINNAHLALTDTYQGLVPAFKALLTEHQGDLPAFYRAAAGMAQLAPQARRAQLAALAPPALLQKVDLELTP